MRDIVAELYKSAGGRVTLHSMSVFAEEQGHDGKMHTGRSQYDVEFSRAYGYIFHMSGFGGGKVVEVSGIYFLSGNPQIKEGPTNLVDVRDKPPWKSKRTLVIRKRNRTRHLKALPKAFDLRSGEDLFDWMERNALHDEAVYCSACRDYFPGEQLCQHCWWCDKTCWYSTPSERCSCKDRDECGDD